MKAPSAEGNALSAAVAELEGIGLDEYGCMDTIKGQKVLYLHMHTDKIPYRPDENWREGGPIIEREMIGITRHAFPDPEHGHQPWFAESVEGLFTQYGDTALIAAMRCYVAMRKEKP
jgi:hypothetical protein